MDDILGPVHLPYSKKELEQHLPNEKHIQYYLESLERYHSFSYPDITRLPLKKLEKPFQIEKDERFWTIRYLLKWYKSPNREQLLENYLKLAFGDVPPIIEYSSWPELVYGSLELIFEASLKSPKSFSKKWLPENLANVQFIPHILQSYARKNKPLEGPTHVDAIIINKDNGFNILFEAKVLSDISYQISYDTRRNQIARNLDVMLESSDDLDEPLSFRRPELSLFILLTPKMFKTDFPGSRLYYYKYHEYVNKPETLQQDLPHRKYSDVKTLSKRIGWVTWEDLSKYI